MKMPGRKSACGHQSPKFSAETESLVHFRHAFCRRHIEQEAIHTYTHKHTRANQMVSNYRGGETNIGAEPSSTLSRTCRQTAFLEGFKGNIAFTTLFIHSFEGFEPSQQRLRLLHRLLHNVTGANKQSVSFRGHTSHPNSSTPFFVPQ